MQIQGKVFIVTGAGSGIGREVAQQLIDRGGRVAAWDLRPEGLAETAALVPSAEADGRLTLQAVDVSDRAAVEVAVKEVVAVHGAVDGLLNVAGIIHSFTRIVDLDYAEIERVINVNFWGVVNTVKTVLPVLLERPEGGCVINVSSMGGFSPVPGQTAYGASKAAVKLLTEGLYGELRGTGVAATAVYPGAIDTGIADNSGVDADFDLGDKQPAMTSAADAARQIIDEGVEKGRYRVLIGKDAKGLDLISRISARRTTEFVAKKMADLIG